MKQDVYIMSIVDGYKKGSMTATTDGGETKSQDECEGLCRFDKLRDDDD